MGFFVLYTIADGIGRTVEGAAQSVSGVFDRSVRLGVTGLSRAGKTVFITSLVANLMDRGRMPLLRGAASGAIQSAFLQPQPDDTVPRFDLENHLATMTGAKPEWPQSTRSISELRLSLRVQQSGLIGAVSGPQTVHLDIVDYPGEWLLDLGLLEKSFAEWSAEILERAQTHDEAVAFLKLLDGTDATAPLDEPAAQDLAKTYTAYLTAIRERGLSNCSPGRFLMPGDLEGSPALTFAPLPSGASPRKSLYREFERRFEAYKSQVVKPFFRTHFARIDRQIILVDVLGALHNGPEALEDLRSAMVDILRVFRPGSNSWLSQIFMGRRVERVLFAATKADHLHHAQHGKLTAIMEALVREASDRAEFSGATTGAMSLAALRTTTEEQVTRGRKKYDLVQGKLESGKLAAMYAGDLPEDPAAVLNEAKTRAGAWLNDEFSVMRFLPSANSLKPGSGPPHIRLDKAAEFLIGDRVS